MFWGDTMFAKQRQDEIVERVNQEGAIKVKEIALEFNVTEDSIRKDLTLLENQGKLTKTYGGAIKIRDMSHDFKVEDRIGKNNHDKITIASKACTYIENGMTIFLDISTINIEIAKLVKESNKDVTVVTNMIDVLITLLHSKVNVVFLGGTLNRREKGFIGSLTIQQIENYQFDLAFIGCVGVDFENERIYTYTSDDGLTKKCAMKHSHQTYVVLESKKLQTNGTYCFSNLEACTGFITEQETITNNNK